MLKNNKLFMIIFILLCTFMLFSPSVFASSGTCNYDVSTLSAENIDYIKDCCNSVLNYCSANNVDTSNYPYYFVLSNTSDFSFDNAGSVFYIVLASSDITVSDRFGYSLYADNGFGFDFEVGSSDIVKCGALGLSAGYGSSDLKVYYTNYSNELVNANNDIDFFPIPLEGILAPIMRETPLEEVVKEIVAVLPVILLTIVGLIGLRKALAFLSTVLRRS